MKTRKTNLRKRKPVIIICCEDKKSARLYFNELKLGDSCRNAVSLKLLKSHGTDPVNLLERTKRHLDNNRDNIDDSDKFFIVFDEDGRGEKKLKAIKSGLKMKKYKRIQPILSNPSFEFWYLLHFTEHNAHLNNYELMNELKKYLADYQKNIGYFAKLQSMPKASLKEAIKRAKELNNMHKKNGRKIFSVEANPATQVFEIIEQIEKFKKTS